MSKTTEIGDVRIPKVGDAVWFYFMHAFWDERLPNRRTSVDPTPLWRWTGKIEMRCRPAVITRLRGRVGVDVDVDVEFQSDDRVFSCNGSVELFNRRNISQVHRDRMAPVGEWETPDPYWGRIIGGRWPNPGDWAWDPMPGFEGGGR